VKEAKDPDQQVIIIVIIMIVIEEEEMAYQKQVIKTRKQVQEMREKVP
jgi:hypothetical protein